MDTNAANLAPPSAGSVSATAYNHPLLQAQPAAKPACKCGTLRPPRKLHAAVGLWLALFLGVHFAIGLMGIYPRNYEGAVGWLQRSLASLPGAVILLVFIPMLLQAASGLYLIAKEGLKYDVKRCDRGGKLRYFLQRWTGLAMLSFLLPHIGSMRGWWPSLGLTHTLHGSAFVETAVAFHPWSSPAANSITIEFVLAGILGTVFHVANGAWSGSVLWKIVQSERGKAWLGYATLVAGLVLADMGILAWYAFSLSPNVHAALRLAGR
jgi:succinate dehydrogenase / fumarate reductase cytochrome b subunit